MCNYRAIAHISVMNLACTDNRKKPDVISCETSLRNSRVIYHHLTWDWFTTSLPLMCKQICLDKVCVWTAQTVHTVIRWPSPVQRSAWSRCTSTMTAVIWQMFPLNDYGDRRLFPVQGKWDKSWIHKQPCVKPQLKTAWMLMIMADQYNHTFHQKNRANHLLKMADLCTVGSKLVKIIVHPSMKFWHHLFTTFSFINQTQVWILDFLILCFRSI